MGLVTKRLAGALALQLLLMTSAFGQASDGNVTGVVYDPSGAVISGAAVEATQVSTNAVSATVSGPDGSYRFNNLPVGRYEIRASADRFLPLTIRNVAVELNRTVTVAVTLPVAGVEQAVEVTDAAAPIDASTAQVSSTYNSRLAQDLALGANVGGVDNHYGVLNLSLTGAGVASSGGIGQGVGPSVGGQRPTNNNYVIDGIDNNRRDTTGPISYVSNEATSSVTVIQNAAAPEFGHSTGGTFNVSVKSGGNDMHGSAYEYLSNRYLNALDASFKRQGINERQRLDQNRLGGALGGAIVKNKLFYFGNFEYSPYGQNATSSSAVFTPTAEGYAALERIPGLNTTNLGVLKQYAPASAQAAKTTRVAGETISLGVLPIVAPFYINRWDYIGSIDWDASQKDKFRGRFIGNNIRAVDSFAGLPAFFGKQPTNGYNTSLTWFRTVSASALNELRVGYTRHFNQTSAGDFAFPGLDAFPTIGIQSDLNLSLGPSSIAPQSAVINTYSLVDNFTWFRGRHTLKAGFDVRRVIAPQFFVTRVRGEYNYSTLDRFLRDLTPDRMAQRSFGNATYWGNLWSNYAYLNDDIRLRPNVTLNLGLRYEYVDVPASSKMQSLNSASSVPGLIDFREPKAQRANFAPRVGLVWSPGNSGTLAIRAGAGLSYDQWYQNLGLLTLPPQFFTTVDQTAAAGTNFLANGGIRSAPVGSGLSVPDARASTVSYIPDQVRPYAAHWTLGVQKTLRNNYVVEVRYLGTRGVHLPFQTRLNSASVVTPQHSLPMFLSRPTQGELDGLPLTLNQLRSETNPLVQQYFDAGFRAPITSFKPVGNSTYHGLATQITKRMSRDLQFSTAYTWSHNIDDSTIPVFSTLIVPRRAQDSYNLRPERASSALDRRHRLAVTGVYDAPWFRNSESWLLRNAAGNLTVSGSYIAESPMYATVQSLSDANLNGDIFGDRALINPAGDPFRGSGSLPLANSAGQVVGYLAADPSARYVAAAPGLFPNAGRQTLPLRGINNVDLSLMKNFDLGETRKLQVRADFVNAFNHSQFIPGSANTVQPVPQMGTVNYFLPGHPDFGNPETAFRNNARTIQLALRLMF
ncbi:MAG: carboxypeptidase regulatory-like domain-containing protein [Bryobacteraceae bacterium]